MFSNLISITYVECQRYGGRLCEDFIKELESTAKYITENKSVLEGEEQMRK